MTTLTAASPTTPTRPDKGMLALIIAAHAGILVLLASLDVVPLPAPLRTLTIDLIRPAAPTPQQEQPKPQARPVELRPQPVHRPIPAAQPVLAAQTAAAAPAAEAPVARDTPPAPPALVTVSEPRFDADYLANPAPVYPAISRRLGEEGKVVLRVHVSADGQPSQIELKAGSGSPRLDQAAQDAVWRWKFVPARRGDTPLAAWVLVPIVFNLKS